MFEAAKFSNGFFFGFRMPGLRFAAAGAGVALALGAETFRKGLDAKTFTAGNVQLQEVVQLNHDSRLLRFKLPGDRDYLVPVSSCFSCEMRYSGQLYRRYYTPINPVGTRGYIDILVKLYPDGKLTPLMWNLKPGDKMRFQYWEKKQWQPNKYDVVGMLAGGVGITPMLQLIREVVTNPYDRTKIKLLFINKTENDIMLREELDRLAMEYPETLEVQHFLTRPAATWTGARGTINPAVVARYMPPPKSNTQIYVCGPHGFYETLCGLSESTMHQWTRTASNVQPGIGILSHEMDEGSMLAKMGYAINQVHAF